MKFEDVIDELRDGKLAKRKHWGKDIWIGYDWGSSRLSMHFPGYSDQYIHYGMSLEDLKANDWEVIVNARRE